MKLTSDMIVDGCLAVLFWPIKAIDWLLPAGVLRFIGYIVAMPVFLATLLISFPLVIFALVVMLWQVANDD